MHKLIPIFTGINPAEETFAMSYAKFSMYK